MTDKTRRYYRKSLTAMAVRNTKGPIKLYDGNGLFLRVEASGARRWVQRLVIRGKSRDLGLGSADLVSLAEAREIEEAARAVHEAHRPTWRNEKHGDQWINTLAAYAFPVVGKRRVSEIMTADVLAILAPIWTEKPETARRVRQRVRAVMAWAIAKGWRTDNPADAVDRALPKHTATKGQRRALPYAEVSSCIAKIQASAASISTKLCLEFTILNAVRSGEARLAHRDEFDLEAMVWTIPAARMKQKRVHRVPLALRAAEIVREARTRLPKATWW
jgi:integrase